MKGLTLLNSAFLLTLLRTTEPVQMTDNTDQIGETPISLKDCLKMEERSNDLGFCFGRDMLTKLQQFEEKDAISFTDAVKLVRDEQTPRNLDSFLDKDPMDFRSIMEGASSLISKRSLQWDLGAIYPGLCMKIGPTLANGILEFAVDPRANQDRGYYHQEESTGHVLAKQFLVPLLLGLKFKLSTILPLILGLLLFASKKAFILAKLAIIAISVFGAGGVAAWGAGSGGYPGGGGGYYSGSAPGGYITRHHHSSPEYYSSYRDDENIEVLRTSTGAPISPTELRQRLERLFVTKNENGKINMGKSVRDNRNFAWGT